MITGGYSLKSAVIHIPGIFGFCNADIASTASLSAVRTYPYYIPGTLVDTAKSRSTIRLVVNLKAPSVFAV